LDDGASRATCTKHQAKKNIGKANINAATLFEKK
jgi:hypothetical protein